MPQVLSKPIELFYPGTHTDFRRKILKVTRSDLEQTAAWFNANNQKAAIVVAHPGSEDENFGYATKLAVKGDRLVATEVDGLDRAFKAIVNSGELPKVSVKFQLPGHPDNPSPGLKLQHIGFFGKSRVALDQLQEASFSEYNDLEFWFMDKGKMVDPEDTMDEDDMDDEDMEDTPPKKKKISKTVEMRAFEAEKAAFEKKVATFRRSQAIEPKVEEWVRKGQISPIAKAGLVAVFAALPEDLEVSFADADGETETQSATEFLTEFMSALPVQIPYGEFAGSAKDETTTKPKTVAFSAYSEDGESTAIDESAIDVLSKIVADGVDVTDTAAFAAAVRKYGAIK